MELTMMIANRRLASAVKRVLTDAASQEAQPTQPHQLRAILLQHEADVAATLAPDVAQEYTQFMQELLPTLKHDFVKLRKSKRE
jgi:hypothetical protein